MLTIGVDIGGTFTDFAVWRGRDEGYRQIGSHKVPTSRPDFAQAVIEGIDDLVARYGIGAEEELFVVHGTTISTNAIIERSQPPVALLTTEGFRDILEIARLRLDKPVDIFNRRPAPLVPRALVFEVSERLRADGGVDTALDDDTVRAALDGVRAAGIGAAGVCLLHAHRNPAHERRILEIAAESHPEIAIMASHEVWPQQSEYERATLTLLNVYVRDLMDGYVGRIDGFLRKRLPRARLFVMKSNGGIMSADEARALPVHTLLSGPAAGVTGARVLAAQQEAGDVLTMDMGGTSTDVSLIASGQSGTSGQAEIGDFPLLLPVTAIEALGAGGGSLVWLDQNVLKVGPKSAGSVPGPACYGTGGTAPTLTDAYLVCNYLSTKGLLGGRLPLSRERAVAAFQPIADQVGVDVPTIAEMSIAVATSNMVAKVLPFLARQGAEAAGLTLMIFGGAGGVHGPLLAAELGMRRALVPRLPSVFCAYGCLVADLMHDAVRSVRGAAFDGGSLTRGLDDLAAQGKAWLEAQGGSDRVLEVASLPAAEMRYAAQAFTVPVALDGLPADGDVLAASHAAFHREHERLFGHADADASVAIDELRVRTLGRQTKPHAEPDVEAERTDGSPPDISPTEHRTILLGGHAHEATPVYPRDLLPPGWRANGPAIIEQDVATILVPPGFSAEVGALGDLWLTKED